MTLACNFRSTIAIAVNLGMNQMGWFFERVKYLQRT